MKNNKNLPLILSALLIVSLLVFFGVKSLSSYNNENDTIAEKYEELNSKYEALLNERNELRLKIEALNAKINSKNEQLDQYISEIQKSNLTEEQLSDYKQKVNRLIIELDDLIAEKKILDFRYAKEKFNNYKSNEEIKDLEVDVMALEEKNKELKRLSKLKNRPYIYSVNVETFNEKRNEVLVSTDKARRVDIIQTCINMESFNYSSDNYVYFQILRPDFTPITAKNGANKKLDHTKKVKVSSLNALNNYCFEVKVDEDMEKLKKGQYILNIYDEDVLISRAFFTLR